MQLIGSAIVHAPLARQQAVWQMAGEHAVPEPANIAPADVGHCEAQTTAQTSKMQQAPGVPLGQVIGEQEPTLQTPVVHCAKVVLEHDAPFSHLPSVQGPGEPPLKERPQERSWAEVPLRSSMTFRVQLPLAEMPAKAALSETGEPPQPAGL